MKLCVNAVNIRSKGGIEHLQNFIDESRHSDFKQIIVWISSEISGNIRLNNNKKLLIKTCNHLFKNYFIRFLLFHFYFRLKKFDIFYSLDGISFFIPKLN